MGKRKRYSATFAKSKGPFIDRNPKGGKKRPGRGKAPSPPAMTLFESKTTIFRASRVSEGRRLEWLAGTGTGSERVFGLKEGAERGEHEDSGEKKQHIRSRKSIVAPRNSDF